MNIPIAKFYDGKKFMWDGEAYETEEQARQKSEAYHKEGFEVQIDKNSNIYLVYSRRVAAKQTQG